MWFKCEQFDKTNFMHWLWDKFCDFLGLTRFYKLVCRETASPRKKERITWRKKLVEKVSRKGKSLLDEGASTRRENEKHQEESRSSAPYK